jgi:hypothetical protein
MSTAVVLRTDLASEVNGHARPALAPPPCSDRPCSGFRVAELAAWRKYFGSDVAIGNLTV